VFVCVSVGVCVSLAMMVVTVLPCTQLAENDVLGVEMMGNFESMVTQLHEATETHSTLNAELESANKQIAALKQAQVRGRACVSMSACAFGVIKGVVL
jgi:hypothetical protein